MAVVERIPVGSSTPSDLAVDTYIAEMVRGASSRETSIPTSEVVTTWNQDYERDFLRLLRRKALEGLSPEEAAHFKALQVARRFACRTRDTKEIILELKRRRATSALLIALRKYVTLFSIENPERRTASEET